MRYWLAVTALCLFVHIGCGIIPSPKESAGLNDPGEQAASAEVSIPPASEPLDTDELGEQASSLHVPPPNKDAI